MKFFTGLFFLVVLLTAQSEVFSSTTGYTGRLTSGTGCTTCHSTQNTGITFSHSGSTTVIAGTKVDWTITVTRSAATKGGIDIGVKNAAGTTVGTVSTTATGLKVASGEITHSSTRTMSNGEYIYSFSWTAPTTPGTYYLRALAVAGAGTTNNWNYMSPITITVSPAPTVSITKPIGGENWCLNSAQNITWNSSNMDNVKIELSNDGGSTYTTEIIASTPASAGTYAWTVPASLAPLSTYKIRISDASNANYKAVSPSNFSILALNEIATQPVAKTVCEGESTQMSVVAKGANLHYEWKLNDMPISGSPDSPIFLLQNCTQQMAGNYSVTITGTCGVTQISSNAKLTVNKPVTINSQPPKNQIFCKGTAGNIKFSVSGIGVRYQWKKNGTNLTGKTDSTLSFTSFVVADSGLYHCEVTSSCGSVLSSDTTKIEINSNPQITKQPIDFSNVNLGDSITLSVIATGGNLQYKWKKNDVDIVPQVNAPNFTIKNAKFSDEAFYSCVISNSCNSSTSKSTRIMIKDTSSKKGPILTLGSKEINFGTIKKGALIDTIVTALIQNTGDSTLIVTNVTLVGTDATEWVIAGTFPLAIAPKESYSLVIRFSSNSCGAKSAQMIISTNGGSGAVDLSAQVIDINFGFPQFIEFNKIAIGTSETQVAKVTNSGCVDMLLVLSIAGSSDCSEMSLVYDSLRLKVGEAAEIPVKYVNSNVSHEDKCNLVIKNQYFDKDLNIPLVEKTVDVEEFSALESISPNPASDYITIQNVIPAKAGIYVEIFNIFGEKISTSSLLRNATPQEGNLKIDISNLPAGVYFIKIGNRFEKFVKM